jgi:hypothetical protein
VNFLTVTCLLVLTCIFRQATGALFVVLIIRILLQFMRLWLELLGLSSIGEVIFSGYVLNLSQVHWRNIHHIQLFGPIVCKLQCPVYSMLTLEEGYYVIAIVGILVSKAPDLKHVQPPYEDLLNVFQCLTKLCQPALILYGISGIKMAFKCLDHDTSMLLYLTCDPGGVLYD